MEPALTAGHSVDCPHCSRHACVKRRLSHTGLFAAARQAPPSMGFSRQEYWSGLPCPAPGDLADLGIETASSVCPALTGGFFTAEPPGKPQGHHTLLQHT